MAKSKQAKTWVEKTREQYAHIPILSMDEIRGLPQCGEFDAGVYFLWLGDELQYIGKSDHISERLALQDYANKYHSVRTCKSPKPIPYDRHTCLVLDSGRMRNPGLREELKSYERAYIAHFMPPHNCLEQNAGT